MVETLIISVSYAWYTNNKETNVSGIGSTASDSISILNQGIFREKRWFTQFSLARGVN